jgi:uncharacterized membrane protein
MAYTDLDTKTCLGTVAGTAHGNIFSHSCPTSLDFNQTTGINITCKNTGTASGSFALLFCAASPSASCDVKNYLSDVFALGPGETKDFAIPITMPNNQISYIATIQRSNPEWVTDDSVSCDISLTSASVAQGQIMSNSCPTSLDAGQAVGIIITYTNIGTASGTFALTFCASSPSASCDVSSPVPEEFLLNPGMTKDISIPITMPNSQISYSATLKHKNPADLTNWITDDIVSCDISLTSPSEAGGSPILIVGLAVGALMMMMSKKKQ